MQLSAPRKIVFLISLIIAIIGLIAGFGVIAIPYFPAFSILATAYVILAASVLLKGV